MTIQEPDFDSMTDEQLHVRSLLGQISALVQQHALDLAARDTNIVRLTNRIKQLDATVKTLENQIAVLKEHQPQILEPIDVKS